MTDIAEGPGQPGGREPSAATERRVPRPARATAAPSAAPAERGRARPYHLVVAVGTAAGVYALSLATVTALQAGTDAEIQAARRPVAEAIAALRADNDALEHAVGRIEAGYATAADAYAALAARIGDHGIALGGLTEATASIEGTAAALPTSIRLPALSRAPVARTSTRPATNATTAASGAP